MIVYSELAPLDCGKLLTTQIDNIYRPLRYPTAIFAPAQFGGLINQNVLLEERVVLNFQEITP